jgi:hypothetical protein
MVHAIASVLLLMSRSRKREPGENPGLPRSGKRERTLSHALAPQSWEATASRFSGPGPHARKSEDLPTSIQPT